MSNTRFNYEPCRSQKKIKESTDPCKYILEKPGPGCNSCYVEDPHIRLQSFGGNLRNGGATPFTDIASDLRGLTRPLTKDCLPHEKFQVTTTKRNVSENNQVFSDESRATHPAWMYRETEHDRWYPLFYKPEDHAVQPFAYYLNSTNEARDNFKPKQPCMFFK